MKELNNFNNSFMCEKINDYEELYESESDEEIN